MEVDLHGLFEANFILMLFSVVGLGYLIGRIKIGSIELGSTTGVLVAGLLFGHFGFDSHPILGVMGFSLFIFTVGLQAGPSFFSVFLADGSKYVVLAFVVGTTAFLLAVGAGRLIGLEFGMSAGLLAGALTSTPTLAGAQDALLGGHAALPDGMSVDRAMENVSVGYAITYIFGTMGLILLIRYFPTAIGIDLPREAARLARERGFVGSRTPQDAADRAPIIRAYRVADADDAVDPVVGKTAEELMISRARSFHILRVRRGGQILEATPDLVVEKGDIISGIAPVGRHVERPETLGTEVLDADLLDFQITTKEIVVLNDVAVGHPLKELDLVLKHGCFVRGIRRAGIDLPVQEGMVLNKGDQLWVTGEEGRLHDLADRVGCVEAEITDTDFLTFSLGIGAGVLLGTIMVKVGNVSIGLGSAGGLLLVGIVIGFLRSIYPTFGGVPAAARSVLMEFGLVLFMAGVGLQAGGGIVEGLRAAGPQLVAAGIVVTIVPVLVGYLFGRRVLELNPALLLGSITGAMTSTPALNVVRDAARSEIPALGYAGTYTFANVLLTLAGTIMVRL